MATKSNQPRQNAFGHRFSVQSSRMWERSDQLDDDQIDTGGLNHPLSHLPCTRREIERLLAEIPEARTNLRFRNDVQRIMAEHREQKSTQNEPESLAAAPIVKQTKEDRMVYSVLKKIIRWRQLYYDGEVETFIDEHGVQKQVLHEFTLAEAALKEGLNKKTLDDYLLNVRYAIKFNFDFYTNQCQSIG